MRVFDFLNRVFDRKSMHNPDKMVDIILYAPFAGGQDAKSLDGNRRG